MPRQKLRIGVAGLGRGFMLTLPTLIGHDGVELAAATTPNKAALRQFARDFGAHVHDDFGGLVADPAVDAIYIASPHEYHARQAIAAARAGKHVLVEKPMATTVADCRAMAAAAREAGTVLIVGPSHGFDAPVALAARLIASGDHGRPRMVTALNYTDFLYRPRRPEELDSSRGGGVVYSQAAHQIDIVRRLVGSDIATVHAVTGDWDPHRSTEGAYTALLTFADGAAATLTYSGYGHFDSDELCGWVSELGYPKNPDAYGEARRKLVPGMDETALKRTRAYGPGGRDALAAPAPHHEHFGFVLVSCERADLRLMPTGVHIYADEERRFHPVPPPLVPRFEVIDELVRAVLDGEPPLHDGDWGTQTMAACVALLESSAELRPVAL